MKREMLKSKIYRVVVTDANLNYRGSITVDAELLEKADILENEKVMVVNLNNGARFDTYTMKGKRGSGEIILNGGSARLAQVGDIIIILSFGKYNDNELKDFNPIILHVNENNKII